MKYKVIKKYNDIPDKPIEIIKGEVLEFIEESDPNGDWPNWILCTGDNKEGWIPKQILNVEGNTVISLEEYTAKEHCLFIDEILLSKRELNGWIWAVKENSPDAWGWAPLNHLQIH
ncbi:MAG: SH3 domain-containing protein [Spirochaetaceae bacterium]